MKEIIIMSFKNNFGLNDLYYLATEFAAWGGVTLWEQKHE